MPCQILRLRFLSDFKTMLEKNLAFGGQTFRSRTHIYIFVCYLPCQLRFLTDDIFEEKEKHMYVDTNIFVNMAIIGNVVQVVAVFNFNFLFNLVCILFSRRVNPSLLWQCFFLTTWFLSFSNNLFFVTTWKLTTPINDFQWNSLELLWSGSQNILKTQQYCLPCFSRVGFFLLCQIYFQTFPELCLAICGRVTLHKQIKSFRLHTGIIRSHKAFLIESRSAGKTGRCSKQLS